MIRYDCIIIVGATASGKTSISIKLAKILGGEIINADSQQLIKGLDIGTAKITPKEMDGVKHHLLNMIEIGQDYGVAEFQKDCLNIINQLRSENKMPIIVGGTGLYINSLLYDYTYGGVSKDENLRNNYQKLAEEKGQEYVHDILKQLDPKSAESIHPNNLKRVIRAIEVAINSDKKISEQTLKRSEKIHPLIIGLNPSRDTLYRRIDERVDRMIEDGLEKEIEYISSNHLYDNIQSLPIGYSEWFTNGKHNTREDVIEQIKLDTRHYAKRQLTWFKSIPDIIWFNPEEKGENEILNSIMQILKKDL